MYILFEEHQYESHLVEQVLKDIYVLQDVNRMVSVQYVGYFYNPHLKDCVFILPKVLLNEREELVGVVTAQGEPATPEAVMTPEGQVLLGQEYRKFVYEFSVWIYRALNRYYRANPQSRAILYKRLPQSGHGRKHKADTYLDIVLSLIAFGKENRDFVLFTIKNMHRGQNKINWTRTIAHSQALVQDSEVAYLCPVNKRRVVNHEEELFIIYYSILNYLNNTYGFRAPIDVQYDLIRGREFEQLLHGMGRTRLMQIRYRYFSDKALQLWDLCCAFFDNAHSIAINTHAQEYILAKNFNIVFEAMIDELIGTPRNQIPQGLADQEDGKRVDHLYTDLALTSVDEQQKREVYYIGDSKYYKSGHQLSSESIYKQYTYARNVIQWNINLFLDDNAVTDEESQQRKTDKSRWGRIRLQDTKGTEGYDVIPNFFIRAFVGEDHRYDDGQHNLRKYTHDGEHCTMMSYQFADRLFDRDTLFLSQYDVNFLYVLYLYARNRSNEKAQWRKHVREVFRKEIREVIQSKYQIYAMRSRIGVDGALYIRQHFYELNGRVFQPYGEERQMYYAYARPLHNLARTQGQYEDLCRYFLVAKCSMGNDPECILRTALEQEAQRHVVQQRWLTIHYLERYTGKGVMLGYYMDKAHLQWILGRNDRGSLVYNVRLKQQGEEARHGAHSASFYSKQDVQFVVLYTDGVEQTGDYRVLHVKDTASKVTEERMHRTLYPHEVSGDYFFYRFDEEVNIGKLRIGDLLIHLRAKQKNYAEGEPLFATAEEVLSFRISL